MGSTKASENFRNITVPAKDDVLAAVNARAQERHLALGQAAISLIEEAIRGDAAPGNGLINLEEVSTDDLMDELVGRLKQVDDVEALTARAEAAEAKLARVSDALVGTPA